jgi:hypothetical protein
MEMPDTVFMMAILRNGATSSPSISSLSVSSGSIGTKITIHGSGFYDNG